MADELPITMNLKQVQALTRSLRSAEKAGANLSKPLTKIGKRVTRLSRSMFNRSSLTKGGGRDEINWPPAAISTIRGRRRKGGGTRLLKVTGKLQRSINFRLRTTPGINSMSVFTRNPIARFHQKGTRRGIPARVIVAITNPELDWSVDVIGDATERAIRKGIKKRSGAK